MLGEAWASSKRQDRDVASCKRDRDAVGSLCGRIVAGAAVAASRSVAGALQWPGKQQLHRPGALLERCSGQEAAVATSGSIAGALQWLGSSSCNAQERCRSGSVRGPCTSVAVCCCGQGAAVAASGSVAGTLQWLGSSSCSVQEPGICSCNIQ